jgi:tRNA-dihydrouridine synthase 2
MHVKAKYLDNHWSLTKFCVTQFKAARIRVTKTESHELRQKIAKAKSYADMQDIMGDSSGEEEMQTIAAVLEESPPREHRMILPIDQREPSLVNEYITVTPQGTQNPEPPGSGAPFLPHDFGKTLPFPNHNATSPTPSRTGDISFLTSM